MTSISLDDIGGTATKIYKLIEKVVIKKGVLASDPAAWEFHFIPLKEGLEGEVFELPTDSLMSDKAFQAQYFKTYNVFAPSLKTLEWKALLTLLCEYKATEKKNKVESDVVYVARATFEKICEIPISEDPEGADKGQALYKCGGFYCLPSQKVLEISYTTDLKIAPGVLSETMYKLGYKEEGTTPVRYNGTQKRSWRFLPEIVDKTKVLGVTPD